MFFSFLSFFEKPRAPSALSPGATVARPCFSLHSLSSMPKPQGGASANTYAVQKNWNERDFVQTVQLGVSQLTSFLNEFGACSTLLAL